MPTDCFTGTSYSRGLRTSDVYRPNAIPKRFDNPSWFYGYGNQRSKSNALYRTTSQEYGWFPPSPHTVPLVYRPLDPSFSNLYVRFGMYRNHSLNTTPNPDASIPWTFRHSRRIAKSAIQSHDRRMTG